VYNKIKLILEADWVIIILSTLGNTVLARLSYFMFIVLIFMFVIQLFSFQSWEPHFNIIHTLPANLLYIQTLRLKLNVIEKTL